MDQTGGVSPSASMPQDGISAAAPSNPSSSVPSSDQTIELVIPHGEAVVQPQQPIPSVPQTVPEAPETQGSIEPVPQSQPVAQVTPAPQAITTQPLLDTSPVPEEQLVQQEHAEKVIQPLASQQELLDSSQIAQPTQEQTQTSVVPQAVPLHELPTAESVLPPQIIVNQNDIPQPAEQPMLTQSSPVQPTIQTAPIADISPPILTPEPIQSTAAQPTLTQQPTPGMTSTPTSFDIIAPQQQTQAEPDTRPDWQKQILNDVGQSQLPISTFSSIDQSQYAQPQPYQEQTYTPSSPYNNGYSSGPITSQQWERPVDPYQYQTYGEPGGDTIIELGDSSTSSGGRGGLLRMVVIGVVAIAILSGTAFAAYTYGRSNGYKQGSNDVRKEEARKRAAETENNEQSSTEEDEAALDFSLVTPEYVDETVEGAVGEQIQSKDGLVVYVKSIDRNFQPTSSSYQPEDDTELVKVNVLVGNAADAQSKTVKNTNFTLQDSAGGMIQPADVGTYEGQVGTLTLTPGNKARFSIVFAVPKNAQGLVFVRKQPYTLKNTGQSINMELRIVLDS